MKKRKASTVAVLPSPKVCSPEFIKEAVMSDTPRTDRTLYRIRANGYDPKGEKLEDFCRQLERENAQLRSQLSAVLKSTGGEAREIAALRDMLMKCRNESDDFELHCAIDAVLFKHDGRK